LTEVCAWAARPFVECKTTFGRAFYLQI
jgi:hypothetical protein